MKRALMLLAATAPLLLAGCEQRSTGPQGPAPSAQPAIADAELPVPADFEEEAARSITAANYKTELDAMESEAE